MRQRLRISGLIGVAVAALALAASASLYEQMAERRAQQRLDREFDERLSLELLAQPSLRHMGEPFPGGR